MSNVKVGPHMVEFHELDVHEAARRAPVKTTAPRSA